MSAEAKAKFSIPSIIALIAGIGVFFAGNGFLVFLLAGLAILMGVLGMLISLSPRARGGIVSFFGVGAGLIGVIMAAVKLLQWIF